MDLNPHLFPPKVLRKIVLDMAYKGLTVHIGCAFSIYFPVRILRIGVLDKFSHLCGEYEYLLGEHGLDEKSIIDKISKFILPIN